MRDKQIKEMTRDIKVAHDEQRYLTSDKSIKAISEYLYNKGYRKASDVIEEYRKAVYKRMEKYTVFGREYIQRVMREVEKEMAGEKDV